MYARRRASHGGIDRIYGTGPQQVDKTIGARKEILVEQRDLVAARLEGMQKTLDLLNRKIDLYEKAILKKEKEILLIEELIGGG